MTFVMLLEVWDGKAIPMTGWGWNEEYMDILGNKVQLNTIPCARGRKRGNDL